MQELSYEIKEITLSRLHNWAGPKDLFPSIVIDQSSSHILIEKYDIHDSKHGMWGMTHSIDCDFSTDKQILRITGLTGLRNDKKMCGGRQAFCFFVFRGDSGHIYTHRTVASIGWMKCSPEVFPKRIQKLGIGTTKDVIQQGDFLLKPSNGNAYLDTEFKHETMGAGHHKFLAPVLYADGRHGRQYKITEPITLRHEAIDGIQHPDIQVPVGIYTVGATAPSLKHSNMRD